MIGIDIEQFARDPYGSGIQRVLQYLAIKWPESVDAHFLVPDPDRDGVLVQLEAPAAADILTLPFTGIAANHELPEFVHAAIRNSGSPRISSAGIADHYTHWLLPEVSYLPSVLERFEQARSTMRTGIIGHDALPLTDPANYRFRPGSAAWVSEYFRMMAVADCAVCISDYAREVILNRLRRSPHLLTTVAHPGGDHISVAQGAPPKRDRFIRLGGMEARKQPVEILDAFLAAVDNGLKADLVFVGHRSASNEEINRRIDAACRDFAQVTWNQEASDREVADLVRTSSAFLAFGTEGYGIPALEAIRLGAPVLYDGIQPAAHIMEGRGARRLPASTPDELQQVFFEAASVLPVLREQLDPDAVPTWTDFARSVAHALIEL